MSRRLYSMVRALILLCTVAAAGPALAQDKPYPKTEDRWAGGTHWRVVTEHGPVHVWIPPSYDRDTAGVVYYIHGHGSSADHAWKTYHLARQFRASRQNAMFIVPEAQSDRYEEIHWNAMSDLKKAIMRGGRIRIPDGPVVVIGHSGAYGTMSRWLDNRVLEEVILLDALYGHEDEFANFLHGSKHAEDHKMIILSTHTLEQSRRFAAQFKWSVFRDRLPADYDGFSKKERVAKLLFIRSQYSHMDIVTREHAIPLLLRLTALAHVGKPAAMPPPPAVVSSGQ
ncbi:MAG TPA: hypothetical protein VL172_18265 [Kofleriaceae bacterium]|nr:hypothetical protein [Kofleriaceae bacterium]